MKVFNIFSLALLVLFISASKGDRCGGHLEGDGGVFTLNEEDSIENDQVCVWVIQLSSTQDVKFKLTRLDSPSATVLLYPEQEAGVALSPIKLTSKAIGQVEKTPGKTLVVVLSRSDLTSGLSFEWNSCNASSPDSTVSSVNFVDSERGEVLWNRFGQQAERLVWALTSEKSQFQTIKVETQFNRCESLNPCECAYFGLFEVTNTGYLRDVTSVCGRGLKFETDLLSAKLVAFAFVNKAPSEVHTQSVDISWSSEKTIQLSCGGIIPIPAEGSSVLLTYKPNEAYENDESCLWTLDNVSNGEKAILSVNFTLVSHGFADNQDGLATFMYHKDMSLQSHLLKMGTPSREYADNIYLGFTSDSEGQGTGFVVKLEINQIVSSVLLGQNFYSSELQGSVTYGPYNEWDIVSFVFNPPKNQYVVYSFDFLDIEESDECGWDHLDIYEIGSLGNKTRYARVCGTKLPPSFSMNNPVLAVFSADFRDNAKGFGLSWKPMSN